MIYLISKIILSLLASLGIGFGMAWMLQMHLAARLREQLNSVIFETKSRIPQLESEITNRDQTIDGLREELAAKPNPEDVANVDQPSKEQEKQIEELRQQVIDLENELRVARGNSDTEAVFELDEEDRVSIEEPELMSDDEFLTDIQDIFEDADDSIEAFGSSGDSKEEADDTDDDTDDIEAQLQSELDGWDKGSDKEQSSQSIPDNVAELPTNREHKVAPDPDAGGAKPPLRAGPVDLKAELLGLEDQIKAEEDSATAGEGSDIDALRDKIENLNESRKELSEIVESQSREMAGLQQQRELQDKSLNVLNQQLELARMANERILNELRELKDSKAPKNDNSQSAQAG